MSRDRDPLATAARELLDAIDTYGAVDCPTVDDAREALAEALAHHETHRSREPEGPAERYSALYREMQSVWDRMEATWWDLSEDQRGAFRAEGMLRPIEDIPEDAAPDPHHEADAALGRALREAREAWGDPYLTCFQMQGNQPAPGQLGPPTKWAALLSVWAQQQRHKSYVGWGHTELEALQAAIAAAPARRDAE